MCGPVGCGFCAGMSIFGSIFMCVLGICIKNNYAYVGEWFHPTEGRGSPTQDQVNQVAANCFIVMAIYIGFSVLSILMLLRYSAKAKAAKKK